MDLGIFVIALLSFMVSATHSINERKIPGYPFEWVPPDAYSCPNGWEKHGPYCYLLVQTPLSWKLALEYCRSYGSELVQINGVHENEFLGEYVTDVGVYHFWTGMRVQGSRVTWSDGTRASLLEGFWAVGQPNQEKHECVAVDIEDEHHTHGWKIYPCPYLMPFVCRAHGTVTDLEKCSNGKAVPERWICDDQDDCGDFTDELYCRSECSSHYTGDTGTVGTQKFALPYRDNMFCVWTIEGPVGSRLKLEVMEMVTEEHQDFVHIFVGGRTEIDSYLLDVLSGDYSNIPLEYFSYNNHMLIKFYSDSANTHTGFKAEWNIIDPLCSETLTARDYTQTLQSHPLAPGQDFAGSSDCEWLIQTRTEDFPNSQVITLEINEIHIGEGHPDAFTVYNGGDIYAPIIARYSQEVSEQEYVISTSDQIVIKFVTQSNSHSSGFSITYYIGCDIQVVKDYGYIKSPGYGVLDVHYGPVECTWTIRTPSGRPVTMYPEEVFSLEDGDDFLLAYASDGSVYQPLYTGEGFTGRVPPISLYSATGDIKLKLKPNSAISDRGFQFKFSISCPVVAINPVLVVSGTLEHKYRAHFSLACPPGQQFESEEYMNQRSFEAECEYKGVWNFNNIPVCREIYCGLPPTIENGFLDTVSGVVSGSTVTYDCFQEYILQASGNTRCSIDGEWNNIPHCIGATCVPLLIPQNSRIEIIAGDGTVCETIIEYTCNPGYELFGAKRLFCGPDGWSYPLPQCRAVRCTVHNPDHGSIFPLIPVFPNDVQVSCDSGYRPVDSIVQCLEDGNISGVAQCENINECESNNGGCDLTHICTDKDGSFECSCRPGYKVDPFNSFNCIDVNECDTDPCDHSCVNTVGSYTCTCRSGYTLYDSDGKSGYVLSADPDGTLPEDILRLYHSCVRIQCPNPSPLQIQNGYALTQESIFRYEDQIVYGCDIGYLLESSGRTKTISCLSSGQWSSQPPTCNRASCLPLVFPSGIEHRPSNLNPSYSVDYGDRVTYQCSEFRENVITLERTCMFDSTDETTPYKLLGDALECPIIDCGTPPDIRGGINVGLINTKYGSNFQLSCDAGTILDGEGPLGNNRVICTQMTLNQHEIGVWDFGTLKCKVRTCPDPGFPPGGNYLSYDTFEVGGTVRYQCDISGYTLDNPWPMVCLSNLQWNSTVPSCRDTKSPDFVACPTDVFRVPLYGTLADQAGPVLPPDVIDNSGRIEDLYFLKNEVNFHRSAPLVAPERNLEYKAYDDARNSRTCPINYVIIDDEPPVIRCNRDTIIVDIPLDTTSISYVTDDIYGTSTPSASYTGGEGGERITYNPSLLNIDATDLFETMMVVAEVEDQYGNSDQCTFIVCAKAYCASWNFKVPLNGIKICEPGDPVGCQVYCNENYYFFDDNNGDNYMYTCNANAVDINERIWVSTQGYDYIPNCAPPVGPAEFQLIEIIDYLLGAPGAADIQPVDQAVWNSCKPDFIEQFRTDQIPQLETWLTERCMSRTNRARVVFERTVEINDVNSTYTQLILTYVIRPEPDNTATNPYQECDDVSKGMFDPVSLFGNSRGIELQIVNVDPPGCPQLIGVATESGDGTYTCDSYYNLFQEGSINVCVGCAAGSYYDIDFDIQNPGDNPCLPCPVGQYQEAADQRSCSLCPTRSNTPTSTKGIGSSSVSDCIAQCPPGTFSGDGLPPCAPCAENTYSNSHGSEFCTQCPNGYITHSNARTSISACKAQCRPGEYSPTGYEDCKRCPLGYYQTRSGSTSCTECPSSSSTQNSGSTNFNQCLSTSTLCSLSFSNCLNGGSCIVVAHQVTCSCPQGYTGEFCEADIDECGSNPCYNNGFCVNSKGFYTCECTNQYRGNRCEIEPDGCLGNQCVGDAMCMDLKHFVSGEPYQCLCPSGGTYTGSRCQNLNDACSTTPCGSHGECEALAVLLTGYRCKCFPGFTGSTCDSTIDVCASNPCLNGGTCQRLGDGSYLCICRSGFGNDHCERRNDPCTGVNCDLTGVCVDRYLEGRTECVCPPHSKVNDDNNALTSPDTCIPTNYCDSSPCTHGTCNPQPNSFSCACLPGYIGTNCAHEVDECASNPCAHGGRCTDDINRFDCDCAGTGFEGIHCTENINDCEPNDCHPTNAVSCEDSVADYKCFCKPGYTGKNCQDDIDECASHPCLHDTTCSTPTLNSYECDCDGKWTGLRCETLRRICEETNPCQNGATCYDIFDGYHCDCKGGTHGINCETFVDLCATGSPCLNGGTCNMEEDKAVCTCEPEYTGKGCEFRLDFCDYKLCMNGATCVPLVDDYSCTCQDGYTGEHCETEVNECENGPCQGAAECLDLVDGCFCYCRTGTSEDCLKAVDRDYDLQFYTSDKSGSAVSSGFPLPRILSIKFHVRYSYREGTGTFLKLKVFKHCDAPHLHENRVLLEFDHRGIHYYNDRGMRTSIAYGTKINHVTWHYIGFTMDMNTGSGSVYASAVRVPFRVDVTDLCFNFGQITVGDGFVGHLTQLFVLGRPLTFIDDIEPAYRDCGHLDERDLILDWTRYTYGSGMRVITPRRCHDEVINLPHESQIRYLPDEFGELGFWTHVHGLILLPEADAIKKNGITSLQQCKDECLYDGSCRSIVYGSYGLGNMECWIVEYTKDDASKWTPNPDFDYYELLRYEDKDSPETIRCPDDIHILSHDRLTSVSWEEPIFRMARGVTSNYAPGVTLTWGEHQVSYIARGEDEDAAFCNFKIFLYYWDCEDLVPHPPDPLTQYQCYPEGDLYGCRVTCAYNDHKLCTPEPKLFTCSGLGSWNPIIPYHFHWPTCGDLTNRQLDLHIEIPYPITIHTHEVVGALEARIRSAVHSLDLSYTDVCVDSVCSNMRLATDCISGTSCTVMMTLTYFTQYLYGNGETLEPISLFSRAIYDDDEFNFTTGDPEIIQGSPHLSGVRITNEYICPDRNQVFNEEFGCLECCTGSHFDPATEMCTLCEMGTYQDQPGQLTCKNCPPGTTTPSPGSRSKHDCKEMCHAGFFFNLQTDRCEGCEHGLFEPLTGQFRCEVCPASENTHERNSTFLSQCFDDCPSGSELTPTGSCRLCPMGTYRTKNMQHRCTPCPSGFITEGTNSTSIDYCTRKACEAGYYLHVSLNKCVACPMNTYQPNKWQTYCVPCPASHTTMGTEGNADIAACLFYCELGHEEYPLGSKRCEPCKRGMYKPDAHPNSTCQHCDDHYTTYGRGSVNHTDCWMYLCDIGQYYHYEDRDKAGTYQCIDCPYGTYQHLEHSQINVHDHCIDCPDGYTTGDMGSTNVGYCKYDCQSGFMLDLLSNPKKCIPCPRGSYKNNNLTRVGPCSPCPDGYTTPKEAATFESDCYMAACDPGSHRDPHLNTCVLCPIGTYQPMKWQDRCISCEPNHRTNMTGAVSEDECTFYCPDGTEMHDMHAEKCTNCTRDKYRSSHAHPYSHCSHCPEGYIAPYEGAHTAKECSLEACEPGEFLNDHRMCDPCPMGQYQPTKWQTQCHHCPVGFTTATIASIDKSACEFHCPAGYEESPVKPEHCVQCPIGTYKDNSESPVGPCKRCPHGYVTQQKGSTNVKDCNILDCAAGQFFDMSDNVCKRCPIGTYQPDKWQTSCLHCPPKYTTATTGSIHHDLCKFYCPSGYEIKDHDRCQPCPRGTYKDNADDIFGKCVTCSPHVTTEHEGSTSVEDCSMTACSAGEYLSNDMCKDCPIGTYQPDKWQMSCIECPQNYRTKYSGSMKPDDCNIFFCPSGYEESPTSPHTCHPCEIGYYKDNKIQDTGDCMKCPIDYITSQPGSVSRDQCDIVGCPEGHYPERITNKCTPCPLNTYQPRPYQPRCLECGTNYRTETIGTIKHDDCLFYCPSGYEESLPGRCTPCNRGYYKDNDEDPQGACVPCPINKITPGDAAESVMECSLVACGKGSYRSHDNMCISCPLGYYNDMMWQDQCQVCPEGSSTSFIGATSLQDCSTSCAPGYQMDEHDMHCEQCYYGFYKPTHGKGYCSACPRGKTTDIYGATSSSECDILLCGPGHEYDPHDKNCIPCARGYFRSEEETNPYCEPCLVYTTAGEGAASERECNVANCQPGSYLDQKRNECHPCPKGTYQSLKWQTKCMPCPNMTITYTEYPTSPSDCVHVDPCGEDYQHGCDVHAKCVTTHTSYECRCDMHYYGDGKTCKHLCESDWCKNGGYCEIDYNTDAPHCKCTSLYKGDQCEESALVSTSDDSIGVVIGVVVGVVVLFAVVILIVCCIKRGNGGSKPRGPRVIYQQQPDRDTLVKTVTVYPDRGDVNTINRAVARKYNQQAQRALYRYEDKPDPIQYVSKQEVLTHPDFEVPSSGYVYHEDNDNGGPWGTVRSYRTQRQQLNFEDY